MSSKFTKFMGLAALGAAAAGIALYFKKSQEDQLACDGADDADDDYFSIFDEEDAAPARETVKNTVKDAASQAEDLAKDASEKVQDLADDMADKAKDAADYTAETAADMAQKAQEKVQETADEIKEAAEKPEDLSK